MSSCLRRSYDRYTLTMSIDADGIETCRFDLLNYIKPQRRNREAEGMKLSGAVRSKYDL